MSDDKTPAGVAALAICESLLIALCESGIVSETEKFALIGDAISALRIAGTTSDTPDIYGAAEIILQRMLSNGNGVRHA
ncbi:hypothetical protein JOD31_000142 [Methylopila capsulata]|uniref:Uncharacterized protein n=1 Tax=Methylopila capsulata TaxID=61654 RepID=A0A9W6IUA4_9HYPH|nr:hypothetical protein [Methylopila capsulata]MBM7849930.1 hypothetical protein [Methylopila capsulata]GLK55221.1 hypothetical protein GCM10008170_12400 [Methylopila capsulata]